jgi:hypothetical protein
MIAPITAPASARRPGDSASARSGAAASREEQIDPETERRSDHDLEHVRPQVPGASAGDRSQTDGGSIQR